jgi:hypothetical protein
MSRTCRHISESAQPNGSLRRSRPLGGADDVEALGPQIGDHELRYTAAS